MPRYEEIKTLPYPAEFLYELVLDVEKYPDFLPWCVGARITERHDDHFIAQMMIGYKFYREQFLSRVEVHTDLEVHVEYVNGPFHYLQNHWKFIRIDEQNCEIDFYVDFEFKNKFLQSLISAFFTEAVHRMISSFEKRAKELYEQTHPVET